MNNEDKKQIIVGVIIGTIFGLIICLILQFTGYPYNS